MSSPEKPAVRAAYMKNLFQGLDERGRLAPLQRLDPGLIRRVQEAPRVSWLPVELNVRTVEALCAELGEERGLALLASCVYAQFETPLWKNLIAPAVRLLGRDPGSLGRWIPAALQIAFRDCGIWSAEAAGAGELLVQARELPEVVARHRLWLRSLGSGFELLFRVCACDGSSQLERLETDAGRARYRLRWKPHAD